MSNFKFDFYPEEVQFPSASPRAPSAIAPPAASTRRASEDNESTVEQALSPYLARRLKPEDYVGSRLSEVVEGQIAWRSADVTLVQAVPSADACPAAPSDSDLVPGVYEGGLKVWEASIDLVKYLASSLSTICKGEGATGEPGRKNALELGCGHGLPGIMALRQGMQVCFSDYNSEVIEQATMPNVRLNVEEGKWCLAEYYCGDWGSLSPLLDEREGGGRFDLILTAETLYTTSVAGKVLQMILQHLALTGQALVASKRFYFGTGGSTQHFRELVATDGRLVCADVHVVDTGKGNIREILKVSWRDCHGRKAAAQGAR